MLHQIEEYIGIPDDDNRASWRLSALLNDASDGSRIPPPPEIARRPTHPAHLQQDRAVRGVPSL